MNITTIEATILAIIVCSLIVEFSSKLLIHELGHYINIRHWIKRLGRSHEEKPSTRIYFGDRTRPTLRIGIFHIHPKKLLTSGFTDTPFFRDLANHCDQVVQIRAIKSIAIAGLQINIAVYVIDSLVMLIAYSLLLRGTPYHPPITCWTSLANLIVCCGFSVCTFFHDKGRGETSDKAFYNNPQKFVDKYRDMDYTNW